MPKLPPYIVNGNEQEGWVAQWVTRKRSDASQVLFENPADLLEDLAPGVRGYTMEVDGALYVPLVMSTKPNSGLVGDYIDGLKLKNKVIRFPSVVSETLRGMLLRRDFKETTEFSKEMNCDVEIYEWRPGDNHVTKTVESSSSQTVDVSDTTP